MMVGVELFFEKLHAANFSANIRSSELGGLRKAWNVATFAKYDISVICIVCSGLGIATLCFVGGIKVWAIDWTRTTVVFVTGICCISVAHIVHVLRTPSDEKSSRHEDDWLWHRILVNYVTYCVLLLMCIGSFSYLLFISRGQVVMKALCGSCMFLYAVSPILASMTDETAIVGMALVGTALLLILPISFFEIMQYGKDSMAAAPTTDVEGASQPLLSEARIQHEK